VQADARFRMRAEDVGRLKVRNAAGDMVPLSTMVTVTEVTGPAAVSHYKGSPSAEVNGSPAPGTSSGQAIALMGRIADRERPALMTYEWTRLTDQQREADTDRPTRLVLPH